MDTTRNLALLIGRVLIAGVFIYDATLMIRFQEANAAYMEQFGVPAILLLPTAAFQFFGGLAIVTGLMARLAALGFAAFAVATALLFHLAAGGDDALIQAGKDFAIAGGFLILAATGPGAWTLGRRGG
jgi:putative oxidoreductase